MYKFKNQKENKNINLKMMEMMIYQDLIQKKISMKD